MQLHVGDTMVIENISKSLAELYKSLLAEWKPNWKVEVIVGDYNLYKLGFVDEIPCSFSLDVSDEELAKRKEKWQPREPKVTTGYLARYAAMVTSGNRGAILEVPKAK